MYLIEDVFRELYRKKFVTLILFVQISISLFLFTEAIILMKNTTGYEKKAQSITGVKDLYYLKENHFEYDLQGIQNNKDKINNFDKWLSDNTNFIKAQFNIRDLVIDSKGTNVLNKTKLLDNTKVFVGGSNPINVLKALSIDENTFNLKTYELESGENFQHQDFVDSNSSNTKKIILGYNYKDYIKVGDIISFQNANIKSNSKYEVIGFLRKGQVIFSNSEFITIADDKAVIPMNEEEKSDINNKYFRIVRGTIIKFNSSDNKVISNNVNSIEQESKELKLAVQCKNFLSDLKATQDGMYGSTKRDNIILGIGILFFSVLNLTITLLYSIVRRKHEFGVKIVCGSSLKNISFTIILEVFIVTIMSGLMSIIFYTLFNYKKIQDSINFAKENGGITIIANLGIDRATIILLIFSSILFTFIVSLIPLIAIFKMKPKDLIGGRD